MTETNNKLYADVKFESINIQLPYLPFGSPDGIPRVSKVLEHRKIVPPPPLAMPGSNAPRALNYLADYSGCGWWRLGAPEMLLNYSNKMIINSLTSMVIDSRFYTSGFTAIKLQRQATSVQKEFVKLLKTWGKYTTTKIIYEVDDIVFSEDIPMFNRCRSAFDDKEIRTSIQEMIELCDEMVVVSDFMKDYYKSKTNQKKITTLPNYAPKMWFDRYYDPVRMEKLYSINKKKPRILVTGSGTHYDVGNQNAQIDDYTHILQTIIRTRKDFQWVFMGGFPLMLKPFIDSGEIIYKEWSPLLEFPKGIYNTESQLTIASLMNNNFNRAKSSIKLTESGHLGLPFVGQDLEPYKNAWHTFNNGSELVDHMKAILKDDDTYMKEVIKARQYADGFWLDDHLDEHVELYTLPYGDAKRTNLLKLNVKS